MTTTGDAARLLVVEAGGGGEGKRGGVSGLS